MTKENCTIFYRTHGGENKNPRPDWYSKELCLKSTLLALDLLRKECNTNFVVIHDGSMEDNPNWSETLRTLTQGKGEIIEKPKSGNAISCFETIKAAAALNPSELVFVGEDDYLWLTGAYVTMLYAMDTLPVDYITGYDHPVRYQPDYYLGADYSHWYNTVHIAADRHWRTHESITMTFGARANTFREDLQFFELYKNNGKGSPEDRELFRHLQSLGPYADAGKFRILMGPMPSLNTHCHLPWLAPNVDWEKEAERIRNLWEKIYK